MELSNIKASEIMLKDIVSISPTDKVGAADILMVRKGIGCILIVENEELVGILTNRDILKLRNTSDIIHKTVSQIMTKNPMIITPNTSLKSIIKIMNSHQIEHLPVVDDGKVVGLVGHNQIFRSILKNL